MWILKRANWHEPRLHVGIAKMVIGEWLFDDAKNRNGSSQTYLGPNILIYVVITIISSCEVHAHLTQC